MTPSFAEMGRARADSLREQAHDGRAPGERRRHRRRGSVRRAIGAWLVIAGVRMMREVA